MTEIYVRTLIDKAAERTGSAYRLAKELGVASSQVYDWRDGRTNCSPADRARIAAFAGEDALQELVRATLDNAKGATRKAQLEQALGKRLQAIGGVIATALVAFSLICWPQPTMAKTQYDV